MSDFEVTFSLSDVNLRNQSSCVIAANISGTKEMGIWILLQSQDCRFGLIFWNLASLSASDDLQTKANSNIMQDFLDPTADSLSFLARSALSESSKLGNALSHITAEKSRNRSCSQRGLPSKYGGNLPVTFGHKIKSSGYAPQGKKIIMFKPQTNWSSANTTFKSSRKQSETKLARRYDTDGRIPSTHSFVGVLESMHSPIYGLSYSPSGDRLAVAQGGGLCLVYCTSALPAKPVSEGDYPKPCAVLAGHGAAVSDVAWSLDGRLLLTCSLDRTARLWQASTGSKPCGLKLIVSSPRGGCANGLGQPINTSSTAGGVPRKVSCCRTLQAHNYLRV
uniref:WD repeat-containing protein 27 n=3 Tax=Schistocephalus solidus TaxID=70667 RepID=A0A0V0JB93_SCHSO